MNAAERAVAVRETVHGLWTTLERSQFEEHEWVGHELAALFDPHLPFDADAFHWSFDTRTGPALVEATALHDDPDQNTAHFATAALTLAFPYTVDRIPSGGAWLHGTVCLQGVRVRFDYTIRRRAEADAAITAIKDHITAARRSRQSPRR